MLHALSVFLPRSRWLVRGVSKACLCTHCSLKSSTKYHKRNTVEGLEQLRKWADHYMEKLGRLYPSGRI
jgi:hypothetical protein